MGKIFYVVVLAPNHLYVSITVNENIAVIFAVMGHEILNRSFLSGLPDTCLAYRKALYRSAISIVCHIF